jgi:hypothetical protein
MKLIAKGSANELPFGAERLIASGKSCVILRRGLFQGATSQNDATGHHSPVGL